VADNALIKRTSSAGAAHVSTVFTAVLDAFATIEGDEVNTVRGIRGTMHGRFGARRNQRRAAR
jgi:hypothetical protein